MIRISRQWLWFSILVFALLLSAYLLYQTHANSDKAINNNPKLPDGYMLNTQTWQMAPTGKLKYRLDSPTVTHYPYQDTSTFETPNMHYYPLAGPYWHLRAKNGRMVEGQTVVYLWGNVRAHRKPAPNYPETRFWTDAITIYPPQNFAETEKPVTLLQPGIRLTGIGMRADFETQQVKLLSDVKGHYEPTQKK